MKKKIFSIIILFIIILGISGCNNKSEEDNTKYALEFKEEYEALNGKTNKNGKEHRTITISENNPYIKVTPEKIVEKIENKETFYLYVGDPLCPWCRSVLEKSIEVAKSNKIEQIYYIDIWDDEGTEILRDKYELKDGVVTKTIEGTESYKKLLNNFDAVLKDYTLTDNEGNKIEVGEKRIFAPNFFYVKDGVTKKMVAGISDKQSDSRGELTEEILKDEEEIFEDFFAQACDMSGC